MWGAENWGEMIWGGAASVPLLGPVGFVAVALCLAFAGFMLQSHHRARWIRTRRR